MAKSIITQDGDLVNYNNLVAISVEERAVGFDEEHSEDEYCIIGTDVKNGEILLYHSSDYAQTKAVMRNAVRLRKRCKENHRHFDQGGENDRRCAEIGIAGVYVGQS